MASYTHPWIVGSSVNVYMEPSSSGSPVYTLTSAPDWANDTGKSNNNWIAVSKNNGGGYARRLLIDTAYADNPHTDWFGPSTMSKSSSNTKKWVINLQFALYRLRSLCGNAKFTSYSDIDGAFGAKTEAAVKAFQKSAGISQDGVVGPTTKAKLVYWLSHLG